jgi:hypothetical protein
LCCHCCCFRVGRSSATATTLRCRLRMRMNEGCMRDA